MVAHVRLRTKENFRLLALKEIAVAYGEVVAYKVLEIRSNKGISL